MNIPHGNIAGISIEEVASDLKENIFGVELAIREGAKTYQDVRDYLVGNKPTKEEQRSVRITKHKQGRNDMCSCGNGLKYKHCCGK